MNKELQADLRQLIQRILSMPIGSVRPANNNQPTEGESYAVIQVAEMNHTGPGTSGKVIKQPGIVTVTIDFLGHNSLIYASQLPLAMRSNYVINALIKMNIGYMNCTAARDLSAIEFERKSRHQVKMMLSYSIDYIEPVIDDYDDGVINAIDIDLYVEP